MDKVYTHRSVDYNPYRLSEYPEAKIGMHYSVDVFYEGQWTVSKLFWHKKDAVAYLSQLTRSIEPV